MGARQSKRSVDITTTPKKEGIPAEGGVVGDAAAPGDGKLERIEEADTKPTTNGIAPHTDTAEDKEKDKDEATEKDKEQQPQQEEVKAEETKQESSGDSPAEVAEVTTPTEATPASPNTATSPDNKETKKKDKKKKWSFRSISFSKKDKTKPSREETPKNGDVTKEEPLAEGGEEENATATTSSPVEEKSTASSPSADEQAAAPVAVTTTESKEEIAAASPVAAAASSIEEKKEEPTPSAPTPVPSVEDKKEEAVEKVEAEKKVVEVSQSAGGQSVADPVEVPVYRVQPVATPSIIERKTSEDLPSLPPSSPPPTPIDPSPLQQARQAAASATALAEALKLPAVAADEEESTTRVPPPDSSRADVPRESRAAESIPAIASPTPLGPSADYLPPTEATFVLAEECPPVVEGEIEVKTSQDVAMEVGKTLANSRDKENVEIEPKVKSVVLESFVVMTEGESKYQESKINRMEETPPLMAEGDTEKQLKDKPLDSKNTQSIDIAEGKAEHPFIPKDVDPFINSDVKGSDLLFSEKPAEKEIVASSTEKVPDVVATAKVINEALPVVECQIKSEINNCEGAMEINVPPNVGHNEKVQAGTLPSTEIETKGFCLTVKQPLSSENFETEKTESSPDEATRRVELIEKSIDSDLSSVEKYVDFTVPAEVIKCPRRNLGSSVETKFVKQSCERPIEYEHDYAKNVSKETEEERAASVTSSTELFINSEEGPLSISEDILVEAKVAMIIPEDDSVEELTDTTESVKVIPETDEEKLDNELESDTALPTEETLISEELEEISVPEDAAVEPLNELVSADNIKNEIKMADVDNTLPSLPEDLVAFSTQTSEFQNTVETVLIANKEEPIAISTSDIAAESILTCSQIEQTEEVERCPLSSKDHVTLLEFCPLDDTESTCRSPLRLSDAPTFLLSKKRLNDSPTQVLSLETDNVPISLEDLPPAPEDTGVQSLDSFDYPLPPEELSCPLPLVIPSYTSIVELPPAPVEHAANPKDLTETLLTPPISPILQSNIDIAIETATIDRSEIPSRDEDNGNDREGSMPLSEPPTISREQSDVELKERLAAECLAKTESQEEALSCQLSNAIPSTVAKEHHQKAPEVEAPVENNVTHDISTTEADEPPKVAPPAIPTEAPASPPTAPAITEDVASVTKAIEEIDISDKAVAAAVNEAIECNTNEIIADAHHQNNINE